MDNRLPYKDILALGFMTFAMFVGAGNIIYPPQVGVEAGTFLWQGGLGFLTTAVGLPIIAIVALARSQGRIEELSQPIGKVVGLIFAATCYLLLGPLFSLPRTAAVSFDVGFAPFFTESPQRALFIYSAVYFIAVALLALFPGKLLDNIGRILGPTKIFCFFLLTLAVFLYPASDQVINATTQYFVAPFSSGFLAGYLTLDTFSSLVFGIVIINSIREKKIHQVALMTRYTIIAGIIAGTAMTLLYIGLFKLGSVTGAIVQGEATGPALLHAYVQHTFGQLGNFFLAFLVLLACLATAVGLASATATFFSQYLPFSYRTFVVLNILFSIYAASMGLSQLTQFALPLLIALYAPAIVLVLLSFVRCYFFNASLIYIPVTLVSFLFGIIDSLLAIQFENSSGMMQWVKINLPLAKQNMVWVLPTASVFIVALFFDKLYYKKSVFNEVIK